MRIFAIDDEPKMLRMLRDAIKEAEPEAEIHAFSCAADVTVRRAECVAKSYPAFWEDLSCLSM